MRRRRRWKVLALGVAFVVLLGAAGGLVARDRWTNRCSAKAAPLDVDGLSTVGIQPPGKVGLGSVAPSQRARIKAATAAAGQSGSPLGSLRGVTLLDRSAAGSGWSVIGSDQSGVLVQVSPESAPRSVTRLDTAGTAIHWARPVPSLGWSEVVADRGQLILVDLQDEERGRLVSIETGTGELGWCAELGPGPGPGYRPAVAADPTTDSVYVVQPARIVGPGDTEAERRLGLVRVGRHDLRNGHQVWQVPVEGFRSIASVRPFRDTVLVSGNGPAIPSTDRYRKLTQSGPPSVPDGIVQARAMADGALRWAYRGPGVGTWVNRVVGVQDDVAVILSRQTPALPGYDAHEEKNQSEAARTTSWLIGLSSDGRERWRQNLGKRLYHAGGETVAAGVVLTVEHSPTNPQGMVVVARDTATGRVRWTVPSTRLQPRFGTVAVWFTPHDEPVLVGNLLLTSGRDQTLISVDLNTGAIRQPLGALVVSQLVADHKSVALNSDGVLLTFDRPD